MLNEPIERRHLLKSTLLAGLAGSVMAIPTGAIARGRSAVVRTVSWLDETPPALDPGQMFGVAWPRGALSRSTSLKALGDGDQSLPVQSWVNATWPDGSVKWTAHALAAGQTSERFRIVAGEPAQGFGPVRVVEDDEQLRVQVGHLIWTIARTGRNLVEHVEHVERPGEPLMGAVALCAGLSELPDGSNSNDLLPVVDRIEVERRGPVQAVVKIEGRHSEHAPHLPFSIRLYFTQGSTACRVVHSVIHDGDPANHFVSGLGVRVDVPLRALPYDRHVRMALGEEQLFAEASMPLTGLRRDPGEEFRTAQVEGRPVPPLETMSTRVRTQLDAIPVWNDFRLMQHSANGAVLQKRTGQGYAWIDSDEARRCAGLASVSDPSGGAAISLRYFWERHPAALHVNDLAGNRSSLTAWLWSPDAEPMDMRSYRGVMGMESFDAQNSGLDITYEDYEPGWDDARGIARTSELMLWALEATPSSQQLLDMAQAGAEPVRLMARPEELHEARVFGDWALPDKSVPQFAAIETQMENLIEFYADEVDRRSWYGFWDHGDVMHTYDSDRHQWRYDIGGYAWDNSELSTDLWLWYQALRTGDARTYRLAEAMTRHTGEVDVYHLGRFAGLGTRHGVQHFSDSSKQPRISTAVYRRIFYYLTSDDRTGDLMRALLGSEQRLVDVVIHRKVPNYESTDLPEGSVEMSFGTVWCSLAAVWLTEWERTGNRRWRDRLLAGMESIGAMPNGWMAGGGAFDLQSGRFAPNSTVSVSHLNAVFGAVEINSELLQLLDVPEYRQGWLDYCVYYNAPSELFEQRYGALPGILNLQEGHSRLTAYAARQLGNSELGRRAAVEFYSGEAGMGTLNHDPRVMLPGGVVEWPGVSTNTAAQWGLAAIQNLALVPDAMVSEFRTI